MEKYPHVVESDGHRGIVIKTGCEAVLFKKEIKEGRYNLKKDLIITHKYQSKTDPPKKREGGRGRDDSDDSEDEAERDLKFFVINHIYECEIAVTNVTPKNKKTTMLYQVPNGSLPMLKTKYIDTENVELKPFETKTYKF